MKRLFPAPSRARSHIAAILIVAFILILAFGSALAQGGTTHKIKVGDTVTGTLDSKNFVQVYTFDARAGDVVTATVTTKTSGLSFAVILTNALGEVVTQSADLTKTTLTLKDVKLSADGAYFITVMRGTGAQGTANGEFTLALTGTRTPVTTGTVTLTQGMSVALTWATNDDMNLEVRDPVGGAVNFRTPTVNSGGHLSNNVNGDCLTTTADNPTETASWPQGSVPGGSYEIIVYFNQACTATPVGTQPATAAATSSSGSVSFAVTVTVDGEAQEPIRGTLNANSQWVASFILSAPNQVQVLQGGPLAVDITPFASKIAAPTALNNRTSVTGTIDRNNAADAWSLQLTAARTVTISLNAASGSLDTFLVLLGSDSSMIATNDDANANTRDSQISQTLQAGKYTIIATRFALQIGGTEGNYTLTINTTGTTSGTGQTVPTATPATTTNNALPAGSIQITLLWNTRADMRLLIRDPNGQSIFSDNKQPTNSGILDRMGNFKCTDTTTTPVTYAYWPTRQVPQGTYEVGVWLQDKCTDTNLPQYTLTVSVGGKQVINYSDRPDPNGAHYLTTFTIDNSGNASAGQGGIVTKNFDATKVDQATIANAPVITYGTPVNGTINQETPYVIYTFQAKKGETVTINMKQSTGNLDPQIFLLGPNGAQINQNDDVTPGKDSNSQIVQAITVDGSWAVVATRYGVQFGGTTGNFELTVTSK